MTHDELLAKIDYLIKLATKIPYSYSPPLNALRAVVELHKPTKMLDKSFCECGVYDDEIGEWKMSEYPCPTVQAIEKELR